MYILVYIWAFICGFTFAVDFQESSNFTFFKLLVILFSPILLLWGGISALSERIWTHTILWFLWEIYVTKDKNWYDFNADKLPRLIEQMQLHHGFLFTEVGWILAPAIDINANETGTGLKLNIDEELTRLVSHTKRLEKILEEVNPIGRKLDFLIQEINREINTIGSKANDLAISSVVVDIKSEIEKIREQIQNIE